MTTPSTKRLPRDFFDDAAPFKIDGVYCKLIPLTREQFCIVWEEDYLWLSKFFWRASKNDVGRWYACRYSGNGRKSREWVLNMHREILGLKYGDARTGDHVDTRQTLDNRRCNLRIADESQQQHNKCIQANNTSGFKGVTWHCNKRKWMAQIKIQGKQTYLGIFKTPEEAHAAYCKAALGLWGEFARFA